MPPGGCRQAAIYKKEMLTNSEAPMVFHLTKAELKEFGSYPTHSILFKETATRRLRSFHRGLGSTMHYSKTSFQKLKVGDRFPVQAYREKTD